MLVSLMTITMLVTLSCHHGDTLDNGVARTPPMGWMSWERFECNTNCDTDPENCISERLLMQMADVMAAEGYRDAGYEYVAIDDCWLANDRDRDGHLQPDAKRFPSGMKALADYIHERGLKFGIYEDIGSKTCAGFPGSRGHMQDDANTFARWGVDMLKFDGCGGDVGLYEQGYPEMSRYLNETGRHIVYSCEWPMYESAQGGKPDFVKIAKYCNMFRDLGDIYDSWGSVLGMIDYFGDDPGNFTRVAGPGAWNDPDQVVIGNFGLSDDQERAQMALWAMMASPMLVSADFRKMPASSKAILLNKYVISINQDPLGIQGRRIKQMGKISAWTKPVLPTGSYAIVFLNAGTGGYPSKVTFTMADLGIERGKYSVVEVFEQTKMGSFGPNDTIGCFVNPSGVYLMRATIL